MTFAGGTSSNNAGNFNNNNSNNNNNNNNYITNSNNGSLLDLKAKPGSANRGIFEDAYVVIDGSRDSETYMWTNKTFSMIEQSFPHLRRKY